MSQQYKILKWSAHVRGCICVYAVQQLCPVDSVQTSIVVHFSPVLSEHVGCSEIAERGFASFSADNFMLEILPLWCVCVCVWTRHASRSHVCYCYVCVCQSSDGLEAGPFCSMPFARQSSTSFSVEADDNSATNPEERISHPAFLPVFLSGHMTLWRSQVHYDSYECVFSRESLAIYYCSTFIFVLMVIVILQRG